MKQFIFLFTVIFSLSSFSQENDDLKNTNFSGHWGSNESNYYLTINDYNFKSYKFTPYTTSDKELAWTKVYSPGTEEFLSKEGNVITTNYQIEELDYYVTVTYTLLSKNDLNAVFDGKLNGDPYHKVVNYKKVYID